VSLAGGPEVHGFVDLLAEDAEGGQVVLDLKWTRGRHHREDLAAGRAVQLATYVAALGDDAPRPPRAGYVRLLQQEFVSLRSDGLEGARVDGPPLAQTWADTLEAWRTWTRRAAAGTLLAAGVAGADDAYPDDPEPLREPNCRFCDYAGLCHLGEVPA